MWVVLIIALFHLGPEFCVLSVLATVMVCIAVPVALATACTIAFWYLSVYLPLYTHVILLLMSAYIRLLLLTPCSVSCLSEDNTGSCLYMYLLLLHESKRGYSHVHMIIYAVIMHSRRLYTWCLLAMLIL